MKLDNQLDFFNLAQMAKLNDKRLLTTTKKVFDWIKAKAIISERGWAKAKAGLAEDWGCTHDCIFKNGEYVESHAYLHSFWATPVLVSFDEEEIIPCFIEEAFTNEEE